MSETIQLNSQPITASTQFIVIATGEYPLGLTQIRQCHLNISFGTSADEVFFKALGYGVVVPSEKPTGDVVVEATPLLEDGKYVQQWTARAFSQEELNIQLAARRANIEADVDALLVRTLEKGAAFDFGELGTLHVQMRTEDRINIIGLKQAAEYAISKGMADKVFRIRTYENVVVEVMAEDLLNMAWAYLDAFSAFMEKVWKIKDDAKVAESLEELPVVPDSLEA